MIDGSSPVLYGNSICGDASKISAGALLWMNNKAPGVMSKILKQITVRIYDTATEPAVTSAGSTSSRTIRFSE
jgi:hypothetical protein